MLHPGMGLVTVRVRPGARRPGIAAGERGIVVAVAAAAERGKANEASRRALAAALGVPVTGVRLRRGARSRTKTFEIDGVDQEHAEARLRAR
jgi:hypothetical protein